MFDYIKCELPLPKTDVQPPGCVFQTKDTPDQYMTVYTITKDGNLSWRPYLMDEVSKSERPYPDDNGLLGLMGSYRRVEGEPENVDFHGDIFFYTSKEPDGWFEYRARFTEGRCSKIDLIEFTPPAVAK